MPTSMTFDIQGPDVRGEIKRNAEDYLFTNVLPSSVPIVVAFVHPARMQSVKRPIVLKGGTRVSVKDSRAIPLNKVMLYIPFDLALP